MVVYIIVSPRLTEVHPWPEQCGIPIWFAVSITRSRSAPGKITQLINQLQAHLEPAVEQKSTVCSGLPPEALKCAMGNPYTGSQDTLDESE